MLKSAIEPMNNNKNELNSEIIFIFNPNPNAYFVSSHQNKGLISN